MVLRPRSCQWARVPPSYLLTPQFAVVRCSWWSLSSIWEALSTPWLACKKSLIFVVRMGWVFLCSSPMYVGIATFWWRPRWRFLALLSFRTLSMVVRYGLWRKHKGIGWRPCIATAWSGFWGSALLTATTLSIWGASAKYPLRGGFWPREGCHGWGTWLGCLRRGTHVRRYSCVCVVPSTLGVSLPSPLSPQCARTFRQLAYHPHKGVGMNALRIDLSGGLALGSCPPGRALRCPSVVVSQILSIAGSGISYLCSFCPFGPVSCGTI